MRATATFPTAGRGLMRREYVAITNHAARKHRMSGFTDPPPLRDNSSAAIAASSARRPYQSAASG